MAPAIPLIFAAIGQYVGTSLALGTIASFAVTTAFSLAGSVVAGAFSSKPKSAGIPDFSARAAKQNQTIRQAVVSRRKSVGTGVFGTVFNYYAVTENKKYHHMVLTVCDGPIASFGTIWIGDEPVNPEDIDGNGNVIRGRFKDKVRLKLHLGATDQAADSDLIAEVADLDSNFRGRGVAYIYARIQWDRDILPNGLPSFRCIVNAQEYDPRTDTTGYTDNAALAWRSYTVDDFLGLGAHGATVSDIDSTTLNAAANVCDEIQDTNEVDAEVEAVDVSGNSFALTDDRCPFFTGDRVQVTNDQSPIDLPSGISPATDYYVVVVNHARASADSPVRIKLATSLANARAGTVVTIADAGTGTHTVTKDGEPRYRASGLIDTADIPASIIEDLMTAMVGDAVYTGGKWVLLPGTWRAGSISYDEGDLRGSISGPTRYSLRENFNAVKGVYASPFQDGEATEYPVITSSTLQAADNGKRLFDKFDQPMTASPLQAQRNAGQRLKRYRTGEQRFSALFSLRALQNRAGDTILLTNTRRGWSDKEMLVRSHTLVVQRQDDGTPYIAVQMELQATAETDFDWDPATEETDVAPSPRLTGTGVFSVDTPTLGTIASGNVHLFTKADGTVVSRIYVPWTTITDELILGGGEVQVRYKLSTQSSSEWQLTRQDDPNLSFVYISPVEDGDQYDIQIRARNNFGVYSDWSATSTHTVVGKTENPTDVTALSVQQSGVNVNFTWTPITDADLDIYEIRFMVAPFVWSDARECASAPRGRVGTTAAVPPSKTDEDGVQIPWVFGIKARDTSGNYSDVAATKSLTVVNPQDVIVEDEQWPLWSGVRGWCLETATDSDNVAADFSNAGVLSCAFNNDGTALYVFVSSYAVGTPITAVYQYDLTVPWTLPASELNAGSADASYDLSPEMTQCRGGAFNTDGTKMFVTANGITASGGLDGVGNIAEYGLSTPWDVSTASFSGGFLANAQIGLTGDAPRFNAGGTKMFLFQATGTDPGSLYQYTLSTPWDVTSASYDSVSADLPAISGHDHPPSDSQMVSPSFSSDGTRLLVIKTDIPRLILDFDLGTAWDVSTISYNADGATYDLPFGTPGASREWRSLFISSTDARLLSVASTISGASPSGTVYSTDIQNKFLRNPLTGNLNARDQQSASGNDFDVFDSYVVNPFANAIYDAPEVDLGKDVSTRIWADVQAFAGPGETGNADAEYQVDYREAADDYDGFQEWTVGEVTTRYVKNRVVIDQTSGVAGLTRFRPTVDAEERTEREEGVSVSSGGTAVVFDTPFVNPPFLRVWNTGNDGNTAGFDNLSATGFTLYTYDGSSPDDGTASWEATGV